MNVPDNLLYTKSHEWIRREGDNIRVGITDHAQAELTDVVFVELPKVGTNVEAKAPVAVVESVKAASDIYAPVKGTVMEANNALTNNPALINSDPFGEGWIFVLKIDNPDDLKNLQSAAGLQGPDRDVVVIDCLINTGLQAGDCLRRGRRAVLRAYRFSCFVRNSADKKPLKRLLLRLVTCPHPAQRPVLLRSA